MYNLIVVRGTDSLAAFLIDVKEKKYSASGKTYDFKTCHSSAYLTVVDSQCFKKSGSTSAP